MESPLKQRLIGAAVLAALAIIFLPMLLKGPDVREPDAAEVPLSMPAAPEGDFETRALPLDAPSANAPTGGVLGMAPRPATPAAQPADAAPVDPEPAEIAAPVEAAPEPDPEPATAAHEPATVAAGQHVLTVGSFANLAGGQALATRLRAAGLPVLVDRVQVAKGTVLRVRVGPFASRAAAEAARMRTEAISGTPSRALVLDAQPEPRDEAPATADKTAPAAPTPALPAAPAKPTAIATASPKAAAGTGFAVQLSAPSVEADANALRDRARAAGFSSYVQRVDTEGGARYRVRIGPVTDRAAAGDLLAQAKSRLGLAGIIVSNP